MISHITPCNFMFMWLLSDVCSTSVKPETLRQRGGISVAIVSHRVCLKSKFSPDLYEKISYSVSYLENVSFEKMDLTFTLVVVGQKGQGRGRPHMTERGNE